jgi:4-amino-4-deoxy-L-arabinose transferase-like glycosyltransferase
VLFTVGGTAVTLLDRATDAEPARSPWRWMGLALMAAALAASLGWALDLWRWRITETGRDAQSVARMLVWFTWPAWPLALWTLWRWRRQLASRHVALPLWFAAVSLVTTLITPSPDRSLLLGLPALATLAAFALPTLKRSVAALIDWFTLLFFSGCALVIWVVWLSLQTGIPAKPAANVARLAPGFEPSFSLIAFLAALAATGAWAWLVRWRAGRNRAAIWKSLVLPAGGAALCWLLLMTLWLPVLDFARSYLPVVRSLEQQMQPPGCVEVFGLDRAQLAALRFHGGFDLRAAEPRGTCPWLVVVPELQASVPIAFGNSQWRLVSGIRRPTDRDREAQLLLYRSARRPHEDPR